MLLYVYLDHKKANCFNLSRKYQLQLVLQIFQAIWYKLQTKKKNKQGNVLSSLFRAVALFFLSTFWWKLFESPYPGCKGSLWSDSHTKCRDSLETRPTHIKFFEFFGNYQVVQDTGDSFLKIWFALKVISYLEVIFMLF